MEEGASSTDPGGQGDTKATSPSILILPVHPSTQCALHKKLREIYCETHQAAICVTCAYNDHPPPTCKTVLLAEKTVLERNALRDLLPNMESTQKDLQVKLDDVTAQQTDAEERYEAEEQKIQAWREATTEELEEECGRLVKELRDGLQVKIGEVNKVADSKVTSLTTTWSNPLETLQKARTASKKVLTEIDRNIALGSATAEDSAATSEAVEEVKQGLLDSVKRARDFLTETDSDAPETVLELKLHEQFGLSLKIVADMSSEDASTSTEGESDVALLEEQLRACQERLQNYEKELSSHKTQVEHLQKDLSTAQTTGAAETKRLQEKSASLSFELQLKTTDLEHANIRAEETKSEKVRTEQLVVELKQGMEDLKMKVETNRQSETSLSDGAASHPTESLLELRRIAKSNNGWKKRVVTKDRVLSLAGKSVGIVSGPWTREAYDYLTGKSKVGPGSVKYAPPSYDRSDYYCINQDLLDKLDDHFGNSNPTCGILASKTSSFSDELIIFNYRIGKIRDVALTSRQCIEHFSIDETFAEFCKDIGQKTPTQVYVVGGPSLSPHKTIRHYLEDTDVRLEDYMTLLFCWGR